MRISAKAQYACVAMVELACGFERRVPIQLKNIADAHGISQRFLVQIMLQLKAAGLVESTRGAAGGYQLATEPREMPLATIIHAIDQAPPSLPSALAALQQTPAVRVIGAVLMDLHQREERRLADITLADLVRQAQPTDELIYQI